MPKRILSLVACGAIVAALGPAVLAAPVNVRVVDANGVLIPGATLSAPRETFDVTAGAEAGTFIISDVLTSTYLNLNVAPDGATAASRVRVRVRPKGTNPIDVTIVMGAANGPSAYGFVVPPAGSPLGLAGGTGGARAPEGRSISRTNTANSDDYQIDDGVSENSIGLTAGGDIVWYNQYTVQANLEVIVAVNIAYGVVGNGTPSECFVLDAAQNLISRAPFSVADSDTDTFHKCAIEGGAGIVAGNVGDTFYVGTVLSNPVGQFPAAIDQTVSQGRSWIAGTPGGACDPANLGACGIAPAIIDSFGLPGNWLVRANAVPVSNDPGACCDREDGTCTMVDRDTCLGLGGGEAKDYQIDANLPIGPDAGVLTRDEFTVSDHGTILDLDIDVLATHTWRSDLQIWVEHDATGTRVMLADRPDGSSDNLGNPGTGEAMVFDDSAGTPFDGVSGDNPTGSFSPTELLSAFNGEDKFGLWSIEILDNAFGDGGNLISWSIHALNEVENPDACDLCVFHGPGTNCDEIECTPIGGACCDLVHDTCTNGVISADCSAGNTAWTPGEDCLIDCPLDDGNVHIEILTDGFASETSWELVDQETGDVIAADAPTSNNTLHTWDVAVGGCGCFDFTIFDSFGDGICCGFGNGAYSVDYNGVEQCSGGQFGSSETCPDIGGCMPLGTVVCPDPVRGACCNFDGSCVDDVTLGECNDGALSPDWYKGVACADIVCETIPTVSEWGLVVMTLLGCTLGTILYGRRRRATRTV